MAGSKVKDNNYYVVLGFMVNELKLKGLEKDVYAIIYGFSQAEQAFKASLHYLIGWTNCSKQGVLKVLKSLTEKKLIDRVERQEQGVNIVYYRSTEFTSHGQLSLPRGQQSLPNNYNNNLINNSNELLTKVLNIINTLNEKAGTKFKPNSKKNQEFVIARLNEGYEVKDFETVISNKVSDWTGTDFEKFLRPSTLFGTKFEGYLNQKNTRAVNRANMNKGSINYDNLDSEGNPICTN